MECSTWNLLSHSKDSEGPFSFMMLHNALSLSSNTTQFTSLTYSCGAPGSSAAQKCKYNEKSGNPITNTANQILGAMSTQIVKTDYFSYMVLSVCKEWGVVHS